MAWAGVTLGDAVNRFLRNTDERIPAEQHNAAAASAARIEVHQLLGILESTFTHSAYLVGEDFSVADIPTFGYCSYAKRLSVADLNDYPRVSDWFNRCESRPAFVRAQAM